MRRRAFLLSRVIVWLRALILGATIGAVWAYLRPDALVEQMSLSAIAIAAAVYFATRTSWAETPDNEIRLGLDVRFSDIDFDPYQPNLRENVELNDRLRKLLERTSRRIRQEHLAFASTLLPLALIFLCFFALAPEGVSNALRSARRALISLRWGASLTIVEGKSKANAPDTYSLSSHSPPTIEVTEDNLIEIRLSQVSEDADQAAISVDLKKLQNGEYKSFQSFQLSRIQDESGEVYLGISAKISDSVDISIPSISSKALASIVVRKLPLPLVQLSPISEISEPWPNDQPLKLRINASAENPLSLVRLVILVGQKRAEELVNSVLAQDLKDHSTEYDLVLEPHIDADIADVEIFAEAVDRSVPKPLVGRSSSLRFKTDSAYGRYQRTLDSLRQVKALVDESLSTRADSLNPKAVELMQQAEKQSRSSPFFDGLDRSNIEYFRSNVDDIVANTELNRLGEVSDRLNQFLYEHELIDDRERDRDFFIALRSLSRLLELNLDKRRGNPAQNAERLKKFIDQRELRWKLRVSRLADQFKPASFSRIVGSQPFHKALDEAMKLQESPSDESRSRSLSRLSQASSEYRRWIEELEKSEDESRRESDSKKQQGLASARNELKELQQRQTEVSQELDRAGERQSEDLQNNWTPVRLKQNSNIEGTRKLEAQMRVLAPNASDRIEAAIESMRLTVESGNTGDFANAESASDLAGRLLRQAESAAQRAQQTSSERGRRRRVTGDQYYGTSITAGDIEIQRQYEVDRKYRDLILEDVQRTMYDDSIRDSPEEQRVLEQYLREVVR
jgi:hypothetical protein